jgi:hypothetical protein
VKSDGLTLIAGNGASLGNHISFTLSITPLTIASLVPSLLSAASQFFSTDVLYDLIYFSLYLSLTA